MPRVSPLFSTALARLCISVALLLLLVSGAEVLRAQNDKEKLERHLQNAQVYLDSERYEQVVEELQQAIAIHHQIPGAYYQLGLAYFELNKMVDAEQAFKKELTFEPPDPYSLYYLGRIRLTDGKTAEAIDWFEKALQIGTVMDVRRRLASAYLSTGKVDQAIPLLEDSVQREPEQGDLHFLLGRAYQQKGRASEARREFELAERWKNKFQNEIRELTRLRTLLKEKKNGEALALAGELAKSSDPDIVLSVGMALGREGLHREALPILQKVIELQPSYSEAYYNMALGHASGRDFASAEPLLEKAVELRPEFYEARMLLGTVLVQLGRNEEAIPHLRVAGEIRSDNKRLLAFLGLQYLQERYYTEAIKTLLKAVELSPDDPDLQFLLIQSHFKNHDFEEALQLAKQAAQKFPALAMSHYHLGAQYDNMGRFAESQASLEKALSLDPSLDEAQLMLGQVLLKQGQAEASLVQFRALIVSRPDSIEGYAGLGQALIQLKRYEETAREMEKAVKIGSELASPHLYLSQAYRALGRMDEAKQQAAIFSKLNQKRAEQRDKNVEREYTP